MDDTEQDELDYEPDQLQERIDRAAENGFKGTISELDAWELDQIVAND